jgi:hypothetical protein
MKGAWVANLVCAPRGTLVKCQTLFSAGHLPMLQPPSSSYSYARGSRSQESRSDRWRCACTYSTKSIAALVDSNSFLNPSDSFTHNLCLGGQSPRLSIHPSIHRSIPKSTCDYTLVAARKWCPWKRSPLSLSLSLCLSCAVCLWISLMLACLLLWPFSHSLPWRRRCFGSLTCATNIQYAAS